MSYFDTTKLDSSVAGVKAEIKRLQSALDTQTGKIASVTPYPIYSLCYQRFYKDVGKPTYSSWGNYENTPERALAEAARVYEESSRLVQSNQAICAENKRIVDRLIQEITNAGIPRTEKKSTTVRGKTKTESVATAWTMMHYLVTTVDSWPQMEYLYKEFVGKCTKWREEIDKAGRDEEAAKVQAKAKIEAEVKRIALSVKYGVDPIDGNTDDIREAILSKDKYIRLAYYLYKNRQDWNEGTSYAATGMNGFTVETATDELIVADIQPRIDDWDGDGRTFRDAEWGYDAIFALAPPELVADLNSLPDEDY
jgi:hypothetical protein